MDLRVIGGPHDGAKWEIEDATDREFLYTRAVDDHVEHLYEVRLDSQTARYVKARLFKQECE